ncbi:MAG: MFS transporter [Spirochaetales bacterium]|nr:MFS transporter [Spirochaetales bacterium]
MKEGKMKFREMAAFAAGDLFGGGAQLVIGFFYLRFLTDVVRINPILAGTVVLLSKVWDAVSDPIMGGISDNTRSRYGRRRPYMLAGFFLIVIAFTMLWYAPDFDSQAAKFAFVAFSYIFFSTVSTIVMVPYTAFSSEISRDVKERGRVNGARLFFSQTASLIGAVLPMLIVGLFPEKRGYLMMGLLVGLFYAVPYLGIFLWCRERTPVPDEKTRFSLSRTLSPFKIRSYRSLIGIYLLAFFVMDVVSAVFTYYMTYFIGREDLLEMVLGTMLITQIAALPLVVLLAEKIGKPRTYIVGAVIFIFGSFALGFYNTSWPIASIFVIAFVVGLGLIGCIVIPWITFPDVTDISELAFGDRRSGAFAGFMTFLRKFSSAIGIWAVGFMLQFSGYILPGDIIVPEDSHVRINGDSLIEIDLSKDGTADILIEPDLSEVFFPRGGSMQIDRENGVLFLIPEGKSEPAVIAERGLKVSQAYNFDPDSTMKSVKSFNQPETFILGLRVIVFVLPGVLLLLAIFIAARFPLTREKHERLLLHYKEGLSDEEVAELKAQLI